MGTKTHYAEHSTETEDSRFLKHKPCDDCGSSDARAVYTDHEHCFSCKVTVQKKQTTCVLHYMIGEGRERTSTLAGPGPTCPPHPGPRPFIWGRLNPLYGLLLSDSWPIFPLWVMSGYAVNKDEHKVEVLHGEPFEDRKSIFQAHLACHANSPTASTPDE